MMIYFIEPGWLSHRAKVEIPRSWKNHPFLLHYLELSSLYLPQSLDKDVALGNHISQFLYPGVLSAGWVSPESLVLCQLIFPEMLVLCCCKCNSWRQSQAVDVKCLSEGSWDARFFLNLIVKNRASPFCSWLAECRVNPMILKSRQDIWVVIRVVTQLILIISFT